MINPHHYTNSEVINFYNAKQILLKGLLLTKRESAIIDKRIKKLK